jgi:hypothetical protein
MTTTWDDTRKPDPQGDDQTQPSKSPGEIESGGDGTTREQGQRGVTSPSQPGRRDRQDPNEYPGGSDDDQHQGSDEELPKPNAQRTGRGGVRHGGDGPETKIEAVDQERDPVTGEEIVGLREHMPRGGAD